MTVASLVVCGWWPASSASSAKRPPPAWPATGASWRYCSAAIYGADGPHPKTPGSDTPCIRASEPDPGRPRKGGTPPLQTSDCQWPTALHPEDLAVRITGVAVLPRRLQPRRDAAGAAAPVERGDGASVSLHCGEPGVHKAAAAAWLGCWEVESREVGVAAPGPPPTAARRAGWNPLCLPRDVAGSRTAGLRECRALRWCRFRRRPRRSLDRCGGRLGAGEPKLHGNMARPQSASHRPSPVWRKKRHTVSSCPHWAAGCNLLGPHHHPPPGS